MVNTTRASNHPRPESHVSRTVVLHTQLVGMAQNDPQARRYKWLSLWPVATAGKGVAAAGQQTGIATLCELRRRRAGDAWKICKRLPGL